jgi:uncharacterized Zn-finger protein
LSFCPAPQMKSVPRRMPARAIGKGRLRSRFEVPEQGEDANRLPCSYCGRRFASDRLPVHERICARASSRPKRVFNSQKQRLAGTEAATFFRRSGGYDMPRRPNTSFKQEHAQLVAALRAARGGKLTPAMRKNLAAGPMRDNREECPYCGRRFGAEQLERHVKSCSGVGVSFPMSRPMRMSATLQRGNFSGFSKTQTRRAARR